MQSYISFLLCDTRLEPKTTKTNIEVGFQQTNNQYKKNLILNNKYVTFCLCVSGQYICPLSACFHGYDLVNFDSVGHQSNNAWHPENDFVQIILIMWIVGIVGLLMEVELIWLEIISAILQHSWFLYWDNNRHKFIHVLQFKKKNILSWMWSIDLCCRQINTC